MSAGRGERAWWAAEPYDPDIADAPLVRTSALLLVIAIGGMAGAAARYGASLVWPTASDAFPWTTFWVNVVGCALMGVLMVLVTERFRAHPLIRPFAGTGVLGGFTTFSTYTVDLQRLLDPGTAAVALAYGFGTVLATVAAVWLGVELTRRVVGDPRST